MAVIHRPQPTLSVVAQWSAAIVGVLAFAMAVWGVGELLDGLWGFIESGSYSQEPFWRTIGLSEEPHRTLGWDRVWWLLLIGPIFLFGLSIGLGDWSTDLKKTARQLAYERKLQMQVSGAFAAQVADARGRRRKRMVRRPMGGWKRLWVVLSLIFGLPIFLLQYNEDLHARVNHLPSQETLALEGQAFWDALYWEAFAVQPRLEECI